MAHPDRGTGDAGGRGGGRSDRDRIEQPRRHGGGRHALSGRQRRRRHARHSALGHRLPVRAAGRAAAARTLAAAQRLAGRGRSRRLLLRPVLRALQHRRRATRRRRAPASRCPPCRCRPCWSRALLGIEPLTARKSAGVAIAMLGVFAALASGLSAAPAGAWRGELIMTGAVLCMAFYNVWSRPFIVRSSALGYLTVGMGAGAAALVLIGTLTGRVAVLSTFGTAGMDRRHLSRRRPAARSPSSSGCWRCRRRARRGSPTP